MNASDTSPETAVDAFAVSTARFGEVLAWLAGDDAAGLDHAELETQLDTAGRDLLRQLLQDHLDLRAQRETRVEVVDTTATVSPTVRSRPATHARWRRCSVTSQCRGWRTGGVGILTCTRATPD